MTFVKNHVYTSCQSDKAQTDSKIDAETSVIVVARLDNFAVDGGTELDVIASASQVNINDLTINAAGCGSGWLLKVIATFHELGVCRVGEYLSIDSSSSEL